MKNIVSWFGTVASIAGAFCSAFGLMQVAFICFSLGSVSWLAIGMIGRDKPLIVLNATFFIANVIGLYRVFLV